MSEAPARRIVVGVDASRNRSGGARGHLLGIIGDGSAVMSGISTLHVWSYPALLDELPDSPWIVKHCPPELSGPLWRQLRWQRRRLAIEARAAGCHVMLCTDAGTVGQFRPSVVMSRDMLSFEPGEMGRYHMLSRAWIRLLTLRYVQSRSLRSAEGAIFLTRYASESIQRVTGPLRNVAIIPHGVSEAYKSINRSSAWPAVKQCVRCLYVSNTAPYKHQWQVARAFRELRLRGYNVSLDLVGEATGPSGRRLLAELRAIDPRGAFITCHGYIPPKRLPDCLARAHVFVFASSCENMPNTLIEAMAAGLPIACSNRGPMPEILMDGGVLFDPEDPSSIAAALESLLTDHALRTRCAARARELASHYSWSRCARETWRFVREVALCGSSN